MARLRQQHPQNYVNSGNIHTDFENVVRYINAAELGNKTIGELLSVLFGENGDFRGPIELRVDPVLGLQYRIGKYRNPEDGWLLLTSIDSLRGPSGQSVGFVEGPFFYNRQVYLVAAGVEDSVVVTGAGSGYAVAPTVNFSAPDDPNGERPTAVATIDGGLVTAITITSPGSGYLTAPTITITPPASGTQATATCDLAALDAESGTFSYGFDQTVADIIVYKNGILLAEQAVNAPPDYTYDTATGTVSIADPPDVALGDKITIYSVRSQAVTNFRRLDTLIGAATVAVAFVHSEDEKLLVWRNGVLQEEGGDADYLASSVSNSITFLDPQGLDEGDKITVITVENTSLKTVAGLMFEDTYTNTNGFIRWDRIAVEDNQIPQSKVSALASSLANKADLYVSSSTPQASETGDLWLDTSRAPAILKFYDGTQWLETSPESSLPTFLQTNAGQYVRVNGTGTGLEYGSIDFSALVPKTFIGAANGVPALDSAGKLPVSQLPEIFSTSTISFFSVWEDNAATVTNKTYFVANIWKTKVRIDGITHKLVSGTCSIRLSVDGVQVGNTFSVNSTRSSENMGSIIEVDGTTTGRRLELVVTNASSANTLDVGLSIATLNI